MDEIASIEWNGFNAISTFSGAGGSSLGYKMAGYHVLWANEFVLAAQDTYRANHPHTYLDTRDIRDVSPESILEQTGLSVGELDLFDGSPPCASFSTSGNREKGWGEVKQYSDTKQRTDDLFFEYVRLLKGLQPKVFVAENVSGLVKGTAKGYFIEILTELKNAGYKVGAKVLNAAWLGVPQSRERLIFVGVRNDLGLQPVHPKPLPYQYTLRDALGSALRVEPIEPQTDISRFAIGSEWDKITIGHKSEKYFQLYKAHPDKPAMTVTAPTRSDFSPSACSSSANQVHPFEKRKFSIAELKRISSFPDDFVLTGDYARQWERMARAVPPVMMMHIAKAIRLGILCKTQ